MAAAVGFSAGGATGGGPAMALDGGPVTAMAIGVQGAGGLMDMAGEVMATGIIGNSRLDRQRGARASF
jgi:hypothetical protein